jgi:hypothetical protein
MCLISWTLQSGSEQKRLDRLNKKGELRPLSITFLSLLQFVTTLNSIFIAYS